MNDSLLTGRENNFLAGVYFGAKGIGVAFVDISTGEYMCAEGDADYIDKLLSGIAPKELLIMRGERQKAEQTFTGKYFLFELEDWIFTLDAASERLLRHFGTRSLKGFGIEKMPEAIIAAGSLLHYLDITKHPHISHITTLSRIDQEKYVRLDRFTIRNLELVQPMSPEGKCLVEILDHTVSPMGARLLRRWVLFPLRDPREIEKRQNVVEYFFRHPDTRDILRDNIMGVGDLERVVGKVSSGRVTPRELVQLKNALLALVPVKAACERAGCPELRALGASVNPCEESARTIASTLREDAPSLISKGNFVAEGVNPELDELRSLASGGKQFLNQMVQEEIQRTGITSLKIGFNNVFGYYIEVRNTHKDKVPEEWIRKQTLVSAERYITPKLKEYEEKILGAEAKIEQLESEIYTRLVADISKDIPAMQTDASALAQIDVLLSFTSCAEDYRYCRPLVDDSLKIEITEGRHPVIERQLPPGEPYISNSLSLDNEQTQIMMITGPNMSGKSALLRQTALITLMAQIGSFVPADAAHIGIVDKIFTRVGASDNISLGESTFMVEMNEAAAILNNMSERSLILFDELGRGTSTYDGISIAWAIVEHIHQNNSCHPKTLFATHYHELNEMEKLYPRISNYNVAVEEQGQKVIFVRKLRKGGSAHSFGIHVARLAGMPPAIVRRADAVLKDLEAAGAKGPEADNASGKPHPKEANTSALSAGGTDGIQLSFFQLDDPLLSQIRDQILTLDINNLTPMQALSTLNSLKSLLTGK